MPLIRMWFLVLRISVPNTVRDGNGPSGAPAFHDLTGGEYKTQEHIHRDVLIHGY